MCLCVLCVRVDGSTTSVLDVAYPPSFFPVLCLACDHVNKEIVGRSERNKTKQNKVKNKSWGFVYLLLLFNSILLLVVFQTRYKRKYTIVA